MVYNWDTALLDTCLDTKTALQRWSRRPENIDLRPYTGKVYGRKQTFTLPYIFEPIENSELINEKFLEFLIHNAKVKLLSDISLGLWMELLTQFDVYRSPTGYVYFLLLNEELKELSKKDKLTEARYILMKEFMDGYSYFDKYEMKQGKSKVEVPISHEYELGDVTIPYNYTLALRKAMFGANQWQNIWPDKLLMDWQYDVIRRMGRKTIIFGPRRMGKTFLLAFLARREIMAQKMNFQNQYRPVSVLYLWLSDAKNMKVVQYLKGMDKMFSKNAEGMFHYSSDQKMYTFRSGKDILGSITFISAEQKDPGIGDYADLIIIDEAIKVWWHIREGLEPIIKTEWAKLLTASTLYYNAPKGWNYDLMLEAERYSMWKDIYKFIDTQFEKFRNLTTKKRIQNTRLEYQELVNEFLDANERVGLRYCIDDIEYLPEKKREAEKEDMRNKNPQRYYAEYYSRYADEGKVFNYNWCLTDLTKREWVSYQNITTVHDSAATYDASAVLVWWRDATARKVVVLEEHEIYKTGYYEDQAKEIKGIISNSVKYLRPQNIDEQNKPIREQNKSDTFFICDGNQKATAELFQMAGINIDLRITYSSLGDGETKSKYIYNEINVPKKMLIDITEKMLENGFVLINSKLKKLLEEFDSYHKVTNPQTGGVKYMKGKTDDFIHAFMMLCYFFYEKLNLKHEITKWSAAPKTNKVYKDEILQAKYQQFLEKKEKQEQVKLTENNQIYFRNHVY